jgi:uncharacterized protein (DUF433 family)
VVATAWPFVEIDEQGVAFVRGTSTKVIEVALDEVVRNRTPHEILAAYPYLSLPQIHAALGYYHEHQEECDRQIDAARLKADELLDFVSNPALQEKLRRLKAGT